MDPKLFPRSCFEKVRETYGRIFRTDELYYYFTSMSGHGSRSKEILGELMNAQLFRGFDHKTCLHFLTWFTTIDSSGNQHYHHQFETLCNSDSFYDLCYFLRLGCFRMDNDWDQISLKSSKGQVTKIKKRFAAAQSEVLSAFTSRRRGGCGGDTQQRLAPKGTRSRSRIYPATSSQRSRSS
ncbi:hypothetical protein PIB30_003969 [Stylosanthes scabra]|uniref:Uncharacterized protein n=1 Tax=Stylosanthes scabra TaxID=79078 RepID=A0ABU6W331_9FABA|nr:hypothetical protein [Stylosanthes scabra]